MDPERSAVEHVGVDHGGTHILVAQRFLDGADVLPPLQEMRGKRVAKGMTAGSFGHSGFLHSPLNSLLHHAWIEVVAALRP